MTDHRQQERAERARDLFLFDSNNCTQSVFRAFADLDEHAEAAVMPLAWALGGGLASQGHVCGTLLGAVMVLGAKLHYDYNLPATEAQAIVADNSYIAWRRPAAMWQDRTRQKAKAYFHRIVANRICAIYL